MGIARIGGKIKGSIYSTDTLIITEGALIQGDIEGSVVILAGTVEGDIKASSRVEMRKPARFEGTVVTPSLIVEDGVIFHGTTKMKEQKN
ncbi:MAG: polymer-forming cytoskeletal protein [Bacteriovoracaceae bacterium]|nr:polymer-forming cytoskeletal protein [Bacteriovoracaceae bacterium]